MCLETVANALLKVNVLLFKPRGFLCLLDWFVCSLFSIVRVFPYNRYIPECSEYAQQLFSSCDEGEEEEVAEKEDEEEEGEKEGDYHNT